VSQKTAAEIAEEARLRAIARGDIIEGQDEEEEEDQDASGTDDDDDDDGQGASAEDIEAALGKGKNRKADRMRELTTSVKTQSQQIDQLLTALNAQNAELLELREATRKKETELPPFDFKAKKREYAKLLAEGEHDKAAELEEEIESAQTAVRKKEIADAVAASQRETEGRMQLQQVERELKAAAREVFAAYPFLDPDSDEHDEESVDEVVALRNLHIKRGMSPGDALRKAADKIGSKVVEKAGDTDENSELSVQERKQKRLRESLKAKADASMRTPPKASKGKERESALPDVKVLRKNSKEFDKYLKTAPKEEIARLRGDFV
jgi:hypothetical protein